MSLTLTLSSKLYTYNALIRKASQASRLIFFLNKFGQQKQDLRAGVNCQFTMGHDLGNSVLSRAFFFFPSHSSAITPALLGDLLGDRKSTSQGMALIHLE
jgi:hypothetical protein